MSLRKDGVAAFKNLQVFSLVFHQTIWLTLPFS